jgi:PAS domain S-box-containing protein
VTTHRGRDQWTSERLIGGAIEAAPIAFAVLAEDGRYVAVNRAASFLSGYGRDELLSLRTSDLSADPRRTRAAVESVFRAGSGSGERQLRRRDGSVVRVDYRLAAAELAGERLLVATWWPVEESDTGESGPHEDLGALARTQERLMGVAFQRAPIAVTVTDRVGGFLAVNDKACELSGYDRDGLFECDAWEIVVAPRELAGRDLTAIGGIRAGEATIRRKGGGTQTVGFRVATSTLASEPVRIAVWWEMSPSSR